VSETNDKLDHILDHVTELKVKVEELEARYDQQSDLLNSIQQWRTGNGALGAEHRMQMMERTMAQIPGMQADLLAVKMVADAKLEGAIDSVLNSRDRTAVAYIKAIGPLVAAIAAIVIAVLKC
jgi:hypothetical protein